MHLFRPALKQKPLSNSHIKQAKNILITHILFSVFVYMSPKYRLRAQHTKIEKLSSINCRYHSILSNSVRGPYSCMQFKHQLRKCETVTIIFVMLQRESNEWAIKMLLMQQEIIYCCYQILWMSFA